MRKLVIISALVMVMLPVLLARGRPDRRRPAPPPGVDRTPHPPPPGGDVELPAGPPARRLPGSRGTRPRVRPYEEEEDEGESSDEEGEAPPPPPKDSRPLPDDGAGADLQGSPWTD